MRPARKLCRPCGATVLHALTEDLELVVLDLHESVRGGVRYAIWDDGSAHIVPAQRSVLANPTHRCPAV